MHRWELRWWYKMLCMILQSHDWNLSKEDETTNLKSSMHIHVPHASILYSQELKINQVPINLGCIDRKRCGICTIKCSQLWEKKWDHAICDSIDGLEYVILSATVRRNINYILFHWNVISKEIKQMNKQSISWLKE